MSPNRKPHLSLNFDSPPRSPPPMYASSHPGSPDSYFCPASPSTPSAQREIIMGGLVSRPSTPRGTMDEYDEKGSIEVPGIILTEPLPDLPLRSPSPPPKQILLLSPATLPIPDPSSSLTHCFSTPRPFSPAFAAVLNGRKGAGIGTMTVRSALLLGGLALGAWHLWLTVGGGLEEVVMEGT